MPHTSAVVRRIAARHGLNGDPRLLPSSGMVNEAWLIGDRHVLRIVRAEDAMAIETALDRLQTCHGALGEPMLLHRDLHPWNLFVDPFSRQLSAVID